MLNAYTRPHLELVLLSISKWQPLISPKTRHSLQLVKIYFYVV